jgi:hypothetical protein
LEKALALAMAATSSRACSAIGQPGGAFARFPAVGTIAGFSFAPAWPFISSLRMSSFASPFAAFPPLPNFIPNQTNYV